MAALRKFTVSNCSKSSSGSKRFEPLKRLERFERRYRRWVTKDYPTASHDETFTRVALSSSLVNDGNVKISSEIVRNVAGRLAKLSNRRVNKYGISVALVFQCSEKRDSDAKNNKRAFFPEETAYERALALVASGVWHLLFADQRALLPEQIRPDSAVQSNRHGKAATKRWKRVLTTKTPSTQSSEYF
jgi:hypothetical protein